jgi:hypothetical protein
MYRMLRRRPSPALVVSLMALVVAVGGVAWAAIPAPDGTIKACYATTNGILLGIPHSKGDLRTVDSSEPCRNYEKTLTWNQQGIPGEPGTPGTPGTPGEPGAPGTSGWERKSVKGVGSQTVSCSPGKKILGGGGSVLGAVNQQGALQASALLDDDTWGVTPVDLTREVQASVVCANVTP